MKYSYTQQDCIDSLKEAYDILGHSPTAEDYRKLDLNPTYSVFYDKFGGWNEAKDAANLETFGDHMPMSKIPEIFDVSQNEWETFTADKRHKMSRWAYIAEYKLERGCKNCGYDSHPSVLDFHHKDKEKKSFNISRGIHNNSIEVIEKEMEKCDVLCANCHRVLEFNYDINVE